MDLLDKKQWERDYLDSKCVDCPWCGNDRLDHSCGNCHSDIEKDICWKYGGLCKKCFIYIHEELPKIRSMKQELEVVCQCDDSFCGKCLSSGCKDKNCPTHTREAKMAWRKRWEVANNKPFPEPENF